MKPILAITMGDPAGIGPEIVVKALAHKEIYEICTPVVIGDYEALWDANRFCHTNLAFNEINAAADANDAGGTKGAQGVWGIQGIKGTHGIIDLINLNYLTKGGWEYKKISELCGKASFEYVRCGIEMALSEEVHGVVTGPISKESINKAGFPYSGHTEIFADFTNTRDYSMLLMSGSLRVMHVTTHVSMKKACEMITKERVYTVINLADEALKALGIRAPRIAVAGLNPHSGENGLFGDEEKTAIEPAIDQATEEGIHVEGPIPPDSVFIKAMAGIYDVVVAMYHDQGHIPVKLSGFKIDPETKAFTSVSGVNCTVGLPIIRSSVDHGTAFDKAGEGIASEESMIDAIKVGVMMAKVKYEG